MLDGKNVRRQLTDLVNQYLLEVAQNAGEREYGQHAIVQTFYYDLLGRRERRAMHQRAAAWYEFEEVDDLRAAMHYQHAGAYIRAAELVTRDTKGHINQGHGRPLLAILEFLEQNVFLGNPLLWVKVLISLGTVYSYLDRNDDAKSAYEAALTALTGRETEPEATLLRASVCRWMSYTQRHYSAASALEWAASGLAASKDLPVVQKADLLIQQGFAQRLTGETDAAQASLTQALDILPPSAVHERMLAYLNLGFVYYLRGIGPLKWSRRRLSLPRR